MLVYRYFSLYTVLLSNPLLIILKTFFQISLYFSNNFSSFIKKDVYLVLSKSLLYALNFGRNMNKGLIF